jgi:hypothetical protein
MSDTPIFTAAEIRKTAEQEFTAANPRPQPPEPPKLPRPGVIHVGDAHLWTEAEEKSSYRGGGYEREYKPALFLVIRKGSDEAIRFSGALEADELDALIEQLQQVKKTLFLKEAYHAAEKGFEEQESAWKERRDQAVRKAEADWQKAQKK